jgi:hypothetical protein
MLHRVILAVFLHSMLWLLVAANVFPSLLILVALGKILALHGGDYEEFCLLGCYTVWLL